MCVFSCVPIYILSRELAPVYAKTVMGFVTRCEVSSWKMKKDELELEVGGRIACLKSVLVCAIRVFFTLCYCVVSGTFYLALECSSSGSLFIHTKWSCILKYMRTNQLIFNNSGALYSQGQSCGCAWQFSSLIRPEFHFHKND